MIFEIYNRKKSIKVNIEAENPKDAVEKLLQISCDDRKIVNYSFFGGEIVFIIQNGHVLIVNNSDRWHVTGGSTKNFIWKH
jgi:hypothetical protein